MSEINKTYTKEYGCPCFNMGNWRGTRFSGMRFGIFLIIIGILLYGRHGGWFEPALFFPLALIIIGLWLAVKSFFTRKSESQRGNNPCC